MGTATTKTFTLYAGADRIPVAVVRKRVKNLNLRVRSDGSASLSIPLATRVETAQRFLDAKAGWIAERIRRRQATGPANAPVPTEGPDAGTLPLWGKLVDAKAALAPFGPKRFACEQDGTDLFKLPDEELRRRIDALYGNEVAKRLPEVAARLEQTMGVSASSWRLRPMKTRWGSCTPATRAIRLNTNLAAYPPICLEAVVAHELTHLMEPSHNARFHMLLDTYCPANREVLAQLKHDAREIASGSGRM